MSPSSLLLLLALGAAPPAPGPPDAGAPELLAVIFGGGTDAASAQDWSKRWSEECTLLDLKLAAGFPKVVERDCAE